LWDSVVGERVDDECNKKNVDDRGDCLTEADEVMKVI